MPLESKHDPPEPPLAADSAAARLEAYEHICRAALPARAPAFLLDAEQLGALFAPGQLEVLVVRPLWRADPPC